MLQTLSSLALLQKQAVLSAEALVAATAAAAAVEAADKRTAMACSWRSWVVVAFKAAVMVSKVPSVDCTLSCICFRFTVTVPAQQVLECNVAPPHSLCWGLSAASCSTTLT